MLGKLYIVATPIGNLADISQRALGILRKVDLILAEDTRVVKKLLTNYKIKKTLTSYHQHSSISKKEGILTHLVKGKILALVSDAGTPGISDPGNELIDFLLAREPKIRIIPIPGASALTAALSVCGFNISKYIFLGFLVKRKRQKLFQWLAESKLTFVFFDSPKRILKTLESLIEFFGGQRRARLDSPSSARRVFVGREMTKMHETLYRGSLEEVKKQLEQEKKIRGEIVVVVEGGALSRNRTCISPLGEGCSIR